MNDIVTQQQNAGQLVVARKALEEATTLPDITTLIDQADVLKMMAKKVGLSQEAQNDWAEYKLDAERKAGAIIKKLKEDGEIAPGQPKKNGNEEVPYSDRTILSDLGVTKNQSSNWQKLADLPEEEYVAFKTETREKGKEITESAAVAKAKHHKREINKKEQAKKTAEIVAELPSITLSSYADWLPGQPDCDLLLTDPPYSTDVDDIDEFAAEWLPMALGKVKPTGRAYVCIGAYPEELRAYLNIDAPAHLKLTNILVWTYRNTLGPSPKMGYKLNWQAILYYEGVDAPPLNCPEMVEQFAVQDINAPDGRQGDRWHAWQKPDALAERFVRHSTKPGDIVLDPFACTGTFILAAAKLGRKGHGCDIDPENLSIAMERGCERA